MKQQITSIAKGTGLALVAWVVLLVVLSQLIGIIFGFLLATLLAGGGLLVWLLLDHPGAGEGAIVVGGIVKDLVVDSLSPDDHHYADDHSDRSERRAAAERREERRQADAYLDQVRRGNRFDGT